MNDYVNLCRRAVTERVGKRIVGMERNTELMLIALLCGGHILLDDVPGTGKTELSKAFAESLSLGFGRVQCVPDMLPSDITGTNIFDMKQSEFRFVPGPVFTNLLLVDEINRAMPKTQSGLLECMQERQVTVDGVTRVLPYPFMVIATQNPVETKGTYELPEAQLDRFFLRAEMGYPDREASIAIVRRAISGDERDEPLPITPDMIKKACAAVGATRVHDDVIAYAAAICERTRGRSDILLGASTRAMIHLVRAAQGLAAIGDREYVIPDDIKEMAVPVLAHRLVLANSLFGSMKQNRQAVIRAVEDTPVPSESIDFSR